MRHKATILRIAIVLAVPLPFAYFSMFTWSSSASYIAFFSFLAFICSLGAAMAAFRFREKGSSFFGFTLAYFLISALSALANALRVLFSQNLYTPLPLEVNIVETQIDFVLLALTMVVFQYATIRLPDKDENTPVMMGGLVSIVVVIRLIVIYIIGVNIQPGSVIALMLGSIAAMVGVVLFSLAAAISFRYDSFFEGVDSFELIMSNVLMALGALSLLIFPASSLLSRGLNLAFQVVGLSLLYLSISTPYFKEIGLSYLKAEAITPALSLVVFIPFLLVIWIETQIGTILIINDTAFLIAHLGAASISATMAYLLRGYSRYQPSATYNPLVAFFAGWTTINIIRVMMIVFFGVPAGLSAYPHIIGGLLAGILLMISMEYTRRESQVPSVNGANRWLVACVLATGLMYFIGHITRGYLSVSSPALLDSAFGRCFLLTVTLADFGIFIYAVALLSGKSEGRLTLEIIAVGFMLLMTVPHFLKSIFPAWSFGWWIGEAFMSTGLAIGPAIIGYQYLSSIEKAQRSEQKATLLSDILLHDINSYHHIMLTSLELATSGEESDENRRDFLENAKSALGDAMERIDKMRQVVSLTDMPSEELEPVNLTSILNRSFELAVASLDMKNAEVEFNSPEKRYYVLANDLLLEVFVNLFKNAIENSPDQIRIDVSVSPIQLGKNAFWNVSISDYGSGISLEKRNKLFSRFMDSARGTGLGLYLVKTIIDSFGGEILVRNRIEGDYRNGTTFDVRLLKAPLGAE